MGANYTEPRTVLAYNSGTIVQYFSIPECSYNSLQVTKTSTGSFSAIRLETSNYSQGSRSWPLDGGGDNGYWVQDNDFTSVYSGSLLTSSATPASVMFHMGNLNSRYARVVINVGHGDVFKMAWHGKSGT